MTERLTEWQEVTLVATLRQWHIEIDVELRVLLYTRVARNHFELAVRRFCN